MDETYTYTDENEDEQLKPPTQIQREGDQAIAQGDLLLSTPAFQAFLTACASGVSEVWMQAKLAGIMAAKRAGEFAYLPHSLNVTSVGLDYVLDEEHQKVTVRCRVATKEKIGAESSALIGCGITLMTMMISLRAVDRNISVEGLHVVRE